MGRVKCGTYIPKVEEDHVPCPEGYHCTDCIYLSDNADVTYLGMEERSSLTDFINTLICKIRKQDEIILKLNNKLNKLNYGSEG